MKNRIIAPTLPVFTLLIISCTAVDKDKSAEPSSGKKEEIAPAKGRKTIRTSVVKDRSDEKRPKVFALSNRANEISNYANQKGYSTKYCFLIDMNIPSGRNYK